MKRDQPKTHFRNGSLSHAIMQMQTPQSSDSYLRARSTFVKFKFQGHMGLFDTYRIELESPRPVANPTEPSPLYLYGRGNLFRQNEFVVLTSSSTNSCQPVANLYLKRSRYIVHGWAWPRQRGSICMDMACLIAKGMDHIAFAQEV